MCYAWLGGAVRERCVFALYFIHSTNSYTEYLDTPSFALGGEDSEVTEVLALWTCSAGIEKRLKL